MNDDQLLRYSRQIMLPQMDIKGQQALLDASVLIIGLGGLGCPAAMYLASSGVGHLILADDDEVDLTNLQRQIAHTTDNVGMNKVTSAGQALAKLNDGVKVTTLKQRLEGEALEEAVKNADVVLDCTDNFSSRFAINAATVKYRVPLVSGAAIRMEGQVSVFDKRQDDSPCYQCLHPDGDDLNLSCSENGVLAPVVGIIGTLQALEAIKLITGVGTTLTGRLLFLDAQTMQFREMKLNKNSTCPCCG
ncbi:MAG: molybdopterin-synthase adenylyltransferase MoeB [Gammaproteobacteria bacterium]|jgi:adenylyltransferase/sulfurtransferase|nr:molybdopterin-synthase adenylyltransferase MoeB [Gammaproteobacteria bacterium]MBT6042786.1 molybdopterin-synthase adenylyltransferase MoeB [Gammaproteobacteria bacterium]